MKSAINSLKRIDKLISKLAEIKQDSVSENTADLPEAFQSIQDSLKGFEDSMCDDLNSPKATSYLFSIVSLAEKLLKSNTLDAALAKYILECINSVDSVLGIFYSVPSSYFLNVDSNKASKSLLAPEEKLLPFNEVPDDILLLANRRLELKLAKDYEECDKIRKELLTLGYIVKDKSNSFEIYAIV